MTFKAAFKPSFFKDLKKLPKNVRQKVSLMIDGIIKDPYSVNAKKLSGHNQLFRCRLGDYRLVYYVQNNLKKIIFLIVAHRKDVYKGLDKLN